MLAEVLANGGTEAALELQGCAAVQLLARGCDDSQVIASVHRPSIEARIVFEDDETARERLARSLGQRLQRLYRQMDRARLVSNTLRLTLIVEGGTTLCHALPLHDPLLPLPQLQRLLRWHLEALELPGPVEETTIELADLLPMEGRQLDLFTRCQEGDVRRLLDELGARWGSNSVK